MNSDLATPSFRAAASSWAFSFGGSLQVIVGMAQCDGITFHSHRQYRSSGSPQLLAEHARVHGGGFDGVVHRAKERELLAAEFGDVEVAALHVLGEIERI